MAANKVYAHRCRFVDYNPSAVTALAFPHLPPILPNGLDIRSLRPPLLAVGHANGNIDLHLWTCTSSKAQSAQGWVHLKVILLHVTVETC
jgi:U3 small nucleolar RNA-associated protein 4